MNFLAAYLTDIGIKKQTNQDSFCIKTANTSLGRVVFCLVCDGMGGLSKGEVASAEVTKAFSNWFDNEFPCLLPNNSISSSELQEQWKKIVFDQNNLLREYGYSNGFQLGTTLTALLIVDENFYIIHIGDSRAYEIHDSVLQLTRDHTLVAKEVELGNLTPEQARNHPKRNVLLQCIGAGSNVVPEFLQGKVKLNCTYMLCTDGFIHKISEEEIFENFNSNILVDEQQMQVRARYLVELDKSRQEQDNISVLLIRT